MVLAQALHEGVLQRLAAWRSVGVTGARHDWQGLDAAP